MSSGFAKKILLANPLGQVADAAFNAQGLLAPDAWFGATAYAFQIYFDFAGYSDMAVGLGRMIGFEFMKNFDAPYHAESITDFWRRWHISLSTFLRDYLYIPLGGNRKGPYRTYVNLIVVMLLGGLWHGASWTFVAWGAYHGMLLAYERYRGKQSAVPALAASDPRRRSRFASCSSRGCCSARRASTTRRATWAPCSAQAVARPTPRPCCCRPSSTRERRCS